MQEYDNGGWIYMMLFFYWKLESLHGYESLLLFTKPKIHLAAVNIFCVINEK